MRRDVPEEVEPPHAAAPPTSVSTAAKETTSAASSVAVFPTEGDETGEHEVPAAPTAAEQREQADAYQKVSDALDSRVELSGRSAKEFEMTFERFLASIYMTAMVQLGLMHQQGEEPRIDIIGARQTIDTLSLLAEKTKGNLTPTEEAFLQNSLYEVRMAYVEVTNALSRPPQPGAATGTTGR